MTEKIAKVLRILGLRKALVVHGEPGVDEVSISGKTKVSQLEDGEIDTYYIRPDDFGLRVASPKEIAGGTREVSAKILRDVLGGREEGAKRDVVLLNAASAIFAAGESETLTDAFEIAREILESGKAEAKLNEFLDFTTQAQGDDISG